jgi:LCP family protein required for cell wall assembly
MKKLNAVFHEGAMASAEAAHDILRGIPINYYAIIDYNGIKNIVNSMGGIPMDIPADMYYVSRDRQLIIDLKKGPQILDGDKAIQFVRFRSYRNGDIGRVEAQQQFIKNAAKKALGSDLVTVANTARKNVISDLTVRALLYCTTNAADMSSTDIYSHMLPGKEGTLEGLSFWIPENTYEIERMLRSVYDPEHYPTSPSAISGSAITGSAVSGSAITGIS